MIPNKDLSIDSENGKIVLNGDKYDLGTQGEIDTAVKDVYSVMGQMGAKNLIIYPYYDPSGVTNKGITYTYDKDGIITANGSTDNNQSYINLDDFSRGLVISANKKYTLTCEKTNDNNKGFAVLYFKKAVSVHAVYEDGTTRNANSDYVSLLYNNVDHTSVTFWVDTDTIYLTQARISINSGTITNAVLKPMLRLASDTDNTYQPYAKTNRELTTDKQDTLTFDNAPTASSDNPVKSDGIKTYVDNLVSNKAIVIKATTSDTKNFTIPVSVWTDAGFTGSNHTALFCGGYNGRVSAGFLGTNGSAVSTIKLGDNTVSATIADSIITLTFNDTVYTDLRLILFN